MLLAIESSSREASIALLEGPRCVGQKDLPEGHTTARELAPAISTLLQEAGCKPRMVQVVAVSQGPGSFTGLRIGVVAAKTFAYAAEAKLIGVDTLQAIAAQAEPAEGEVQAVIDAQRKQLFCRRYRLGEPTPAPQGAAQIVTAETWKSQLKSGDFVTGPGLAKLSASLPDGVILAPPACWRPLAETIGRLAWRRWEANDTDDFWSLEPEYYRQSAAEEKADAAK